jgi:hypothetical protein
VRLYDQSADNEVTVTDPCITVPEPPTGASIGHFLHAAAQALTLPEPRRGSDRLPYLTLLEQRSRVVLASIGRLLANPNSESSDFMSEADHVLHQIADMPPGTYRHRPAE